MVAEFAAKEKQDVAAIKAGGKLAYDGMFQRADRVRDLANLDQG